MSAGTQTVKTKATPTIIREATPEDADSCGRIFYDAFDSIAARHNHPSRRARPNSHRFLVGQMLQNDGYAGLVAERGGEVLGSAFIDERSIIAGIGPVSVDPRAQDAGVGRALMEAALEREHERASRRRAAGADRVPLSLVGALPQAGLRRARDAVVVAGTPPAQSFPGLAVRAGRR
jgi:GNAT superfamily N-acetyltransferase